MWWPGLRMWTATLVACAGMALWGYSLMEAPSRIWGDEFFGLAKGGIVWVRLWAPQSVQRDYFYADPRRDAEYFAEVILELVRMRGVCWWVHVTETNGDAALWPVVTPAILIAGVDWTKYLKKRKRRRLGRCLACNYDRRGLAADTKCPECGTVPSPAAK